MGPEKITAAATLKTVVNSILTWPECLSLPLFLLGSCPSAVLEVCLGSLDWGSEHEDNNC